MPPAKSYYYDYQTLEQLTGKSAVAIRHDSSRGNFDTADFASVVLYVARHATPELKASILLAMTETSLDLTVANRKRDRFKEQRRQDYQKKAASSASSDSTEKAPKAARKKKATKKKAAKKKPKSR